MSVRFTRQALRDLIAIQSYIAIDQPIAAARFAARLILACDGLTLFPRRGRLGIRSGTRELTIIWPYLIAYRILADETVEIETIWHGARNRGG